MNEPMNPLSIKLESNGQQTRVSLAGDITEHTDFAPILEQPSPELVFDLAEVRRINSCGVREWITLVNKLNTEGKRFVLERCSIPIVNQLNMIANFRGGAQVSSIFAPYFCASCNKEHLLLVAVGAELDARLRASPPCPTCSAPMTFDDLPEAYTAFLG